MSTTATLTAPIAAEEQARYRDLGLWSAGETLSSLLARNARELGDDDAVVDATGQRLTYRELDRAASCLAAALHELGVRTGDVVGVQMPNLVASTVITCALEKLGAVVNPLVPMFRDREIEYVARLADMVALFVPGAYRRFDHDAMALRVARTVPSLRLLATLTDAPAAGLVSLRALIEDGARSDALRRGRFDDPKVDPDAPAGLLFTSGTESDPKGALHTNNTLYSNSRALRDMLSLDETGHIFMASPVGHGTGYGFGTRFAVFLGSKLVLQDIWDPVRAARTLAAERCVYTHASTTFAHDLLDVPDLSEHDFGALRWFVSGGASIPSGFAARMRDAMGCTLLRLFGQTEGFMTTINQPGDSAAQLDELDGRPAPGVELAIWDDGDRPLGPGEVGEVVYRGPHRCRGFLARPELTAATITPEGWLRSGDLGTLDEDGYLTVAGRRKEVISRGGYKFSPREVEELMIEHPHVSRAVLVRMPDPRLGERACAFVIPEPHREPTLEELVDYLRARGIAPFKLPERLEVVDELPTTASGKVQKFVLERRLVEG